MKFEPMAVEMAEGKILAHNIAHRDGRGVFRKGKKLTTSDLAMIAAEGYRKIYIAELQDGDVDENTAAQRVAAAAAGLECGLAIRGPSDGRVSLVAGYRGVLQVDAGRLDAVNTCEGIAFATRPTYSLLNPGQEAATVKIIPYALPASLLEQAERAAAGDKPLIQLLELKSHPVGLVFSSWPAGLGRVVRSYEGPLYRKIEAYGSQVAATNYVRLAGESDDELLAEALTRQLELGVELVILAGDTSTMDRNDLAPRAVGCAGGRVESIGAPVEPGNLLMLAFVGKVPVLGVPGCVRSHKMTVVDWALPALLAGVGLTRADIARLGYGGLLQTSGPQG